MAHRRPPSPLNLSSLERGLDSDEYSMLHPSTASSAAATGASRGESSVHSAMQFDDEGGLVETPSSTFGKVIFISERDLGFLCLGKIGGSSRFCIEERVDGENHCGKSTHGKRKMDVIVEAYYGPGGMVHQCRTARIEPMVLKAQLPPDMVDIFENPVERSDWNSVIIDAAIPDPKLEPFNPDGSIGASSNARSIYATPASRASSGAESVGSYRKDTMYANVDRGTKEEKFSDGWASVSSLGEANYAQGFSVLEFEQPADAQLKTEDDDKSWTPASREHETKLFKLGLAVSRVGNLVPRIVAKVDKTYKPNLQALHRDMLHLKSKVGTVDAKLDSMSSLPSLVGDAHTLGGEFGSLVGAIENAFNKVHAMKSSAAGTAAKITQVAEELRAKTRAWDTESKNTFRVISKVVRTANTRTSLLEDRIVALENARLERVVDNSAPAQGNVPYQEPSMEEMIDNMLRGNSTVPPAPIAAHGDASPAPVHATVSLDSVLGQVDVGGNPVNITARDLLTRIQVLENRPTADYVGNGGVSFFKLSFTNEMSFTTWFVQQNPTGRAMASVVDLMSLWEFANTDQVKASEWLQTHHRAQGSGFKNTLEPHYATTFANRYPKAFVGTVDMVMPTDKIKIFSSIATWRGNGIGDGMKERLLSAGRLATLRHRQYVEDNLASGTYRDHCIRSADYTFDFLQSLITHIDDEMSMLTSIGMPEKEVLLLLSHQVVQIFDDLYSFRQLATNVDPSNKTVVAARYAWVSFQALDKMQEYGKCIRAHPGIIGTFVRFLTRMTAESSAGGMKSKLTALDEKIKKLVNEKAPLNQMNKVENKLELIIRVNELKRAST